MPGRSVPAPVTGKRKRGPQSSITSAPNVSSIHITVGSYERVLHGFVATVPRDQPLEASARKQPAQKSPAEKTSSTTADDKTETSQDDSSVTFTDAFLLAPHSSSIRAVAVSPELNGKRYLASGGADERINVYQIGSIAPPSIPADGDDSKKQRRIVEAEAERQAALAGRELGTLTPHTSMITGLTFCGHAKLLSTSNDNTICVTRTRDWTPLTTLRAPHPQSAHRPDGDTYAPGEGPSGLNSCGIHPSQKLAISVGIGERTMRLWDLVRGKKQGVLTFKREVLQALGERGTLRDGEGKQVEWNEEGDKFVVAFEKGVAVFDIQCNVIGISKVGARDKVGCVRWVNNETLAVATERGRVLFISTRTEENEKEAVPTLGVVAQLAQASSKSGTMSRIKDMRILAADASQRKRFYVVTGSSDGAVRIHTVGADELAATRSSASADPATLTSFGELLATHETSHRITSLAAFVMNLSPASKVGDRKQVPGAQSKLQPKNEGIPQPALMNGKAASQLESGSTDEASSQSDDESDSGFEGFDDT